jgi:hypothetical protein
MNSSLSFKAIGFFRFLADRHNQLRFSVEAVAVLQWLADRHTNGKARRHDLRRFQFQKNNGSVILVADVVLVLDYLELLALEILRVASLQLAMRRLVRNGLFHRSHMNLWVSRFDDATNALLHAKGSCHSPRVSEQSTRSMGTV